MIEDNILELRKILVAYLVEKTANEADRIWETKSWNDDKVDFLLSTKLRIDNNLHVLSKDFCIIENLRGHDYCAN